MANWPTNPEWIEPTEINTGKEYNAGDGLTNEDMNAIISNLIYLKNRLDSNQ